MHVVDVHDLKWRQQIKLNFEQDFLYLTEWLHKQNEFNTEFESMEVKKMKKCLSKFYVSVTRKENSFYNLKTSLLSVRAALDHHQKSPPHNNRVLV